MENSKLKNVSSVLLLGIFLGFIIGFIVMGELQVRYGEGNNTTYTNAVETCNQNLLIYINQTPNFATCETQDECDLKQLKYGILQQDAFECMNKSWEYRK